MSRKTVLHQIANFIGGFGYLSVSMQWLWAMATLLLPILSTDYVKDFVLPARQNATAPAPIEMTLPPFVESLLVVISILFAIGVTLYALIIVPKAISRKTHQATKKTAVLGIEQIHQKKLITKPHKRRLVARFMWLIKLALVSLPLLFLFIPTVDRLGLAHQHVVIVGLFLGVVSLGCFSVQFLIARLTNLPDERVW